MQYLDPVQIYTIIDNLYDITELRQMCSFLHVDYEALYGDSKSEKARSLVMQMEEADQLEELAAYLYETRPSITPAALEPHVRMEGDAKPSHEIIYGDIVHGDKISGDIVHGDKIYGDIIKEVIFRDSDEAAPPTAVATQEMRLDTAYPAQVQPDRSFELAVAIRQTESPSLQEEGLDQTKSGDLYVEWPEGADSAALRIHISAPDCDTHGQDEYSFRLRKGQDSPVFYFQLTPRTTGRIGIIVTVYQEQEWLLGMTRLHTDVQEQLSGTVKMNIESRPIVINNYGDTYNMSGEFNGSNLNIKSTLKDVNQTINHLPRASEADKAALQRHIAQLNRVLQETPPDMKEEADAMAQMAEALIKSADGEKPNKMMMEITGEGLKQAAENLAGIVPNVVKIAGALVAGILGLA